MVVKSADLRAEINDFLGKELAAHLSDIKTLEPPPDRVVGASNDRRIFLGNVYAGPGRLR